jgi:hypothetical protein
MCHQFKMCVPFSCKTFPASTVICRFMLEMRIARRMYLHVKCPLKLSDLIECRHNLEIFIGVYQCQIL